MNMELIETVAHQLDVGAQLLCAYDSVRARLALILTDNAIELLLYSHAEDALHSRQTAGTSEPPLKVLREALDERFDPKVRYARFVELTDDNETQFLREAHNFRCQAYHTGRVHDDVLWELTHAYHDIACNVLSRVRPRDFLIRFDQAYEKACPTIAKYLGKEPPLGLSTDHFPCLSNALGAGKPMATRSLPAALRTHLLKRLDRIRGGVRTLLRAGRLGSPFHSVNDLLFELQKWDTFYSHAPEGRFTVICASDGTCEVDPSQKKSFAEASEALRNWRPNVTERTLAAWEEQIRRLDEKVPSGRVLQMYSTLSSKMLPFSRIVEHRLAWLEIAIERHQGK